MERGSEGQNGCRREGARLMEPEERTSCEVERDEGVDLNRRGPSKDGDGEGDATTVDKDS